MFDKILFSPVAEGVTHMKLKLLFVVNVDWFFVSHRLPIAKMAVEKGFDVHLACGVTDKLEEIEEASNWQCITLV